jgi:uncharacterized protein
MKHKLFYLILILSLSQAHASLAANYPKPEGWVSDYAGILDPDAEQRISSVIYELEQKTSAEIAVVTVKDLGNEAIESLSVKLFEEWGIGKKGKDNGVLIITAVKNRKVRIEVGYGLEGVLPDGLVGEILDTYVLPSFKKGDYGQGLTLAVFSVASIIARDKGVTITGAQLPRQQRRKADPVRTVFNIIFLIIMGILFIRHPFLFLLLMSGGRGGRFGGGGFGGGFGGFGGGMSGGGGASRGW